MSTPMLTLAEAAGAYCNAERHLDHKREALRSLKEQVARVSRDIETAQETLEMCRRNLVDAASRVQR